MKQFTDKLGLELLDKANELFEEEIWMYARQRCTGKVELSTKHPQTTGDQSDQWTLTLSKVYSVHEKGYQESLVTHPKAPKPTDICHHSPMTLCSKCGKRL